MKSMYLKAFTALLLMAVSIISSVCCAAPAAGENQYAPPWSAPLVTGVNITVPGVDNVPDLHGDVNDPALVIFFAGNQYMLVNELLAAFGKRYPAHSKVFAETLPPGILAQQIKTGSLVVGNMRIQLVPDLFAAGHGRVMELQAQEDWFGDTIDYARNRLAIMTRAGNPKQVTGWKDLAAADIQLCMPNPKWEGIAQHAIIPALRNTGGDALVNAIYKTKVNDGTTWLTHIHHRQTPAQVMAGKCDAGAVWYTEAYFHRNLVNHPTDLVEIPASQNKVVTYTMGMMKYAPHKQAAADFLKFLMSDEGQGIYQKYGFMPPT